MTRGLGPGAGHAAGWGLVLGYLFTGIACVLGFEIYGDQFLVGLGLSPGNHAVRAILYLVGGLAPALVSVLDIRISQRAAFILEAVSVTIILILCIAVYVHNGSVIDHPQLTLSGFKPGGLVVGMVLAIFAFVGFESAGALGQEARNPARSVPRAILWSCGAVGVFYLIVSYAQLYGFGAAGFAKASAPLPQLANRVGLGPLSHFIAIGITFSMFACALACLNAGSRMLLSFAHDGLAPKALAHTSPRTRAPDFAIWAVAIPMTAIPVVYILAGSTDAILSSEMGTLATYGFMLAYALVCIAAPLFLSRPRRVAGPVRDPRRPGRAHHGLRLLRQLGPAADPERRLRRPDLAPVDPALHLPGLDRGRPGLVRRRPPRPAPRSSPAPAAGATRWRPPT